MKRISKRINAYTPDDIGMLERGGGYPFVYLAGKVYVGKPGQSHSDMKFNRFAPDHFGRYHDIYGRLTSDGSVISMWGAGTNVTHVVDAVMQLVSLGFLSKDAKIYFATNPEKSGMLLRDFFLSASSRISKHISLSRS